VAAATWHAGVPNEARWHLLAPIGALWALFALAAPDWCCGLTDSVGVVALGPDTHPSPRAFDATGQLERLPAGPADVLAETVELGCGFQRRPKHSGLTFSFVVDASRYRRH
jgi:hypothetical protein